MVIYFELIGGVMLGCEWFTDDEDETEWFILDLVILRVLFNW